MGSLRFYLAVCVYIWHCYASNDHHFLYSFAAVYSFFILSGFYITMAINGAYAGSGGILRFYANRILRLFPIYLAVLAATALLHAIGLVRHGIPGLNSFGVISLLDQITVLPHVIWMNITGNTVPSANTLVIGWYYTVGLEMMFYAIAPFFLRWSSPSLILLFVAAGVLHFVPIMLGLPHRQWQYEFFPSTLVFFIGGALSYHLYRAINLTASRHIGWILLPAIVTYGLFYDFNAYTNAFAPIALYVALALLLPFLYIASRDYAFDAFLADIAYPLYVVHGLGAELTGGGVGILKANPLPGLIVSIVLAIALLYGIQRPLDALRDHLRGRRRTGRSPVTSETQHSPLIPVSSPGP